MELRTLNYFLKVAEKKNITRAAEALHMTQPSLSRQIRDLEKELGTTLMKRSRKGLTLTESGITMYRYALEIISLTEKARSNLSKDSSYHLSIGTTEALSSMVPDIMQRYLSLAPNTTFEVISGNIVDLQEKMTNNLLDFALVRNPVNEELFSSYHLAGTDYWGLAVPLADPLAEKHVIDVQELAELPLVIPGRLTMIQEITSWIPGGGLSHVVATYNRLSVAFQLTGSGLGYTICPGDALKTHLAHGLSFIPISPMRETNGILIWKRGVPLQPAEELFLRIVKSLRPADL